MARPSRTLLGSSTGHYRPPMGNRQRASRSRYRYPTLRHIRHYQGFPAACPSMADYGGVGDAAFGERDGYCAGFGDGFAA